MRTIKITLLGEPIAKQSTRIAKTKKASIRTYTNPKHTKQKQNYQLQIKKQLPNGFKLFEGGVTIESIFFVFYPTKKLLRSKQRLELFQKGMVVPKTTKPDLPDNLKKLPLDALSGLVYNDDSQIWREVNATKVYGFNPRIEIVLTEQPTSDFISDSQVFQIHRLSPTSHTKNSQ